MKYSVLLFFIFFICGFILVLRYNTPDRVNREGFVVDENREKVFSVIRKLEEKVDSLEYDIAKQNDKLKEYDKTFEKYKRGEEAMAKAAKEQQEKVANDLKNRLENELQQLEGSQNMGMNEYNKKSTKIEKMASQLEIETNNIGKQTSGLNANSPQGQEIVGLIDNTLQYGTPGQAGLVRNEISNLGIPPGVL